MNKWIVAALLVCTASLPAWAQAIKKHAFGVQLGAYDFTTDLSGWGIGNGISYTYQMNPHIGTSFFVQNAYGERNGDSIIPPDYDSRVAGGWTLNGSLYGQQSPFDLTFQAGLIYGRTVRMQYNIQCPTPLLGLFIQRPGTGIGRRRRVSLWKLGTGDPKPDHGRLENPRSARGLVPAHGTPFLTPGEPTIEGSALPTARPLGPSACPFGHVVAVKISRRH